MSLQLLFHPLSSYCWKALVGLYETGAAFEPRIIDLGDAASRAELLSAWPMGKFPVLRDLARGQVVPESSIIIEYLDQHYPGPAPLIPADLDLARRTRLKDRFFDAYVHNELQRIVANKLRPDDAKDPMGVEQARATIRAAYDVAERDLDGEGWAVGEAFTLADCAAAPAFYYANLVEPLGPDRPRLAAYLERLKARTSFARVLEEAQPYLHMFPGG